jgi:hypothetical protein
MSASKILSGEKTSEEHIHQAMELDNDVRHAPGKLSLLFYRCCMLFLCVVFRKKIVLCSLNCRLLVSLVVV